jgi:hypothetical protein
MQRPSGGFHIFCTVEELQFCRNTLICRKNMGLMGLGNELDQQLCSPAH